MEEEDKKAERDLEILKEYHKKDTKSVKKIFITLFLLGASVYIVKLLMEFFSWRERFWKLTICKLGWAPEYESQPILLRTLQRTLQLTLGLARETDQLTEILCV